MMYFHCGCLNKQLGQKLSNCESFLSTFSVQIAKNAHFFLAGKFKYFEIVGFFILIYLYYYFHYR